MKQIVKGGNHNIYTFPFIPVSDRNKKSIGRNTNFDRRKHLTQLGKNMKEISEVPGSKAGCEGDWDYFVVMILSIYMDAHTAKISS
jgi:hypothetical protein